MSAGVTCGNVKEIRAFLSHVSTATSNADVVLRIIVNRSTMLLETRIRSAAFNYIDDESKLSNLNDDASSNAGIQRGRLTNELDKFERGAMHAQLIIATLGDNDESASVQVSTPDQVSSAIQQPPDTPTIVQQQLAISPSSQQHPSQRPSDAMIREQQRIQQRASQQSVSIMQLSLNEQLREPMAARNAGDDSATNNNES